jgi:hypothetical protein
MMHGTVEATEQAERRQRSRKRVLLSGIVTYWDGARSFGCSIRNLSEEGARISKPRTQPLPEKLYLISVRERMVHEAKLVWSHDREAGLVFVNSSQLSELADPKYNYLRRLSDGATH